MRPLNIGDLKINVPIIQGGMGIGISLSKLASAVANMGGVGIISTVGIGLTGLVAAVSPMPTAVAPRWVTLGVALGVAVGMIAGVYPAARAARLDPVDALRYE